MRFTRRHLQLSLAVLWLLDGALQCQPYMFSRNFALGILAPASQGQPSLVAGPLHVATTLVSAEPVLANAVFALSQFGLGLLLLTRRHARAALIASVAWSLGVWFVGEGLGGVVAGATLLSGAPGAALLYAVIAILAWPSRAPSSDDRPSWLAIPAWCLLWLTGAGLQFVAGNNSASSLTMMLKTAGSGSPKWLAHLDLRLATLRIPAWLVAGVIATNVLVALWAMVPGWTRQLSVAIGVVMALAGWLLFQGLGDLTSGRATDPNSGPLVVLLALAVLGTTSRRHLRENSATVAPLDGTSAPRQRTRQRATWARASGNEALTRSRRMSIGPSIHLTSPLQSISGVDDLEGGGRSCRHVEDHTTRSRAGTLPLGLVTRRYKPRWIIGGLS